MGYNNQNAIGPVICDIETAPHPCAAEFVEPPDLENIQAPKNYVKAEAIADYIEREKKNRVAEHADKLNRAALDWNLSRIVALGWSLNGGQTVTARTCQDETAERVALEEFWDATEGGMLVGFCIRTFDAPTLIQRSRLLDATYRRVNLSRYNNGSIIDLRDVLTFDDARYEALMPRSLKAFCKRFGVPVEDDINGADIPALVEAGDWAAVMKHVTSDVKLTAALARRIGVLSRETQSEMVF